MQTVNSYRGKKKKKKLDPNTFGNTKKILPEEPNFL